MSSITYRAQWCANLQSTWQKDIPISDAMGIRIQDYTGDVFTTHAPLANNVNVHSTMFAGSIYSLGTLTCWGLLHLQLLERQLDGAVVLADGNIQYHKPVSEQPSAVARLEDVKGDFSVLNEGKNAHLNMTSTVFSGERPVAEFTGRFVVLAKRD